MKKTVKQRKIWLAAAMLVLIGSMKLPEVMAYFTTYVSAAGGYPVTLGNTTTIKETVKDMTKHIVIANTGETDCYIRVKVFCGEQFTIDYSMQQNEDETANWSLNDSDGYWYYKNIIPVGGESSELLAKINLPKDWKESFQVVVVQECVPVLYHEDGTPYADWNQKADTKTDIGTANGEEGDAS